MKLPGINLSRVSLPGVQSPSTAVAEYQSRQAVAENVQRIGQQIGQMKADYDIAEATAAVAERVSDFEKQYGGRQSYSAQDIRDLGLDDQIKLESDQLDADGLPMEREEIPAHEVYPIALQRISEETIEQSGKNIASPQVRRQWLTDMRQRHNEAVTQATVRATQNAYRYEVSRGLQRIENAQAQDNYEVAQAYIEALPVSEEEKQALRIENEQLAERNQVVRIEASGDPEMMEEAADALASDDYSGALNDEARNDYAVQLRRSANAARAEEIAQREREIGEYVSDLELGVKDPAGQTTVTQVKEAYDRGFITKEKRTSLLDGIRKRDEDQAEQAAMVEALNFAGANGIPLDPGDKKVRKAVNGLYESQVMGGQDPITAGMEIMQAYQIMPDGIKGILRASNRGDSSQLVEAAKLYNTGVVTAPNSMKDVTPESVGIVSAVAANMRLGMNDADAVASVQAWEAKSDAEKKAYKDYASTNADDNLQAFKDLIDDSQQYDVPWSFSEVEPTITMSTEFDMLADKYMNVTGNAESAQQMAFDTIRQRWKLTDINGDWEYMKYAPGASSEIVRQDIESIYGPNTMIRSDPATEQQALNGEPVTYSVYKLQHDPDPLPADGWQEEFQRQTGMNPIDINITTRKEADRRMQSMFSIGNYGPLPRYSYDAEKANENSKQYMLKQLEKERKRRRDLEWERKLQKQIPLSVLEDPSEQLRISTELPVPERALEIQRQESETPLMDDG